MKDGLPIWQSGLGHFQLGTAEPSGAVGASLGSRTISLQGHVSLNSSEPAHNTQPSASLAAAVGTAREKGPPMPSDKEILQELREGASLIWQDVPTPIRNGEAVHDEIEELVERMRKKFAS